MATIKKKTYSTSTSYPDYVNNFMSAAFELLGGEKSGWEYKLTTGDRGPSLRKKTSDGYYGWVADDSSPTDHIYAQIGSLLYDGRASPLYTMTQGYGGQETCVVWEGDNGSVGMGLEISGKPCINLIAAKFNGTYDGHDIYALGSRVESNTVSNLLGLSGNDIGIGVNMSTTIKGNGVYLHPLFDPYTGLACQDVFGVQCYDRDTYANRGIVVKQGNTSYITTMGSVEGGLQNTLFIKT